MGIPTLISTATAINAASVDITSGIDSTYDEYMFVLTGMNPATDTAETAFQVNVASASGFDETFTSTFFAAAHKEDDSATAFAYDTANHQAQATGYQHITGNQGNDADSGGAMILHLFNPASTTYVTHFCCTAAYMIQVDSAAHGFTAGYINSTAAVDEISFKMKSGNFDGVIQMYGIS